MSQWSEPQEKFFRHLEVAGHSPRTINLYRCQVRWITELAESPDEITAQMLIDFMHSRSWKETTRKSFRSTCRTFFDFLFSLELIDHNPAAQLPVIRSVHHEPRPVPEAILEQALKGAGNRERQMLLLGSFAGLRCCEICKIHRNDWDEEGRLLRIMGKGKKERFVPIAHPELMLALNDCQGFLFEGRDGGHLSPGYVCRLISACLPDNWTAHTLRHRMATKAYAASHDILVVGKLLGHSKPETTQGYISVGMDALRETVRLIS